MRRNRTSRQPELLVHVARPGHGPMHLQIGRAVREAVRTGRLAGGAPVPSTRALARDLGVSRGVVVEAYDQLIAEGYLTARAGARTTVAAGAQVAESRRVEPAPASPRFDFRPGVPDVVLFPRAEWARSMRRALRELRPDQLGYGDPHGVGALRAALADYLGRVRGVLSSPESIVVCTGFAQALGIIGRALFERGVRRVAVEDPGHPDQRRLLTRAGLHVVGVPVDDRGLRVDRLERIDAGAVLLTPAHQFPAGSVLAPERRRSLLAWAARGGAFLIEDDYDAEYRYDRTAVGALQGLAPDRVIYAGSASKILAPAFRLGWLVVPAALLPLAREIKRYADLGSSTLEQLAYSDFLRAGELDRHLRRMRVVYRRRRDVLLAAMARYFPGWTPQGAAAGLHLVARLAPGLDEKRLLDQAEARSVRVYPMSAYRFAHPGPPALVLGYAHLGERDIAAAIARLVAAPAGRLPPTIRHGRTSDRRVRRH